MNSASPSRFRAGAKTAWSALPAALLVLLVNLPVLAALPHRFETPLPSVWLAGPLSVVLERLEALGGVRIRVDWLALAAAGVRRDTPVALAADNVTPAQLLSLVLSRLASPQAPLAWLRQDDVVLVSTQLRVLHGRALLARSVGTGGAAAGEAAPAAPLPLPAVSAAPARPAATPPSTGPVRAAAPLGAPRPAVTSYVFDQTPLRDVVEFFRTALWPNIFVNWGSLQPLGITPDTPITLEASNLPPQRALDMVLEQLTASEDPYERVWWVRDRGVITIASGQALDTQMRVEVVDVTDLVTVLPNCDFNFEDENNTGGNADSGNGGSTRRRSEGASITRGTGAQSLSTGTGISASAGTGTTGSRTQQMYDLGESLVRMVRDSIDPRMWQPEGKGTIRFHQNKLIVSQSLLGFKMLEH
jgi:hypothetical protein